MHVGLHVFLFFYRISDKIKILKISEKQLDLLKTFITYYKCRLKKEKIAFIEPNEALCTSQILRVAVDSVLKEINEAESKLKELELVTEIYTLANNHCTYLSVMS